MAPRSTVDVQFWWESPQLKEHSNWRWVERFRIASTWSNNWTDGFSKQKLNHVDEVGPYSFPFWGGMVSILEISQGKWRWTFTGGASCICQRSAPDGLCTAWHQPTHQLVPLDEGKDGKTWSWDPFHGFYGVTIWQKWEQLTTMKNPSSHLIKYIELQSSILQSFWGW